MSIEIPSRKMRDILNDEQIFLLIYNDGTADFLEYEVTVNAYAEKKISAWLDRYLNI